jgi:hypothetical protein
MTSSDRTWLLNVAPQSAGTILCPSMLEDQAREPDTTNR